MKRFDLKEHEAKEKVFFEKLQIDPDFNVNDVWNLSFSNSGLGMYQGATFEDCTQYRKGRCDGGECDPEYCIELVFDNLSNNSEKKQLNE